MKLRNKKISFKLLLIIFIIGMAIWNVNYIGKKMTPRIRDVTFDILEKNIYFEINTIFKGQYAVIEDLLDIKINDKGQIVYVDYRYDNVNSYLKDKLDVIFNTIESVRLNSIYYNDRLDMMMVPVGIITDNLMFNNLGPKIPCRVNILNNVDLSIKTRVSSYGINSSLIEVFVLLDTKSSIINPVVSDKLSCFFDGI